MKTKDPCHAKKLSADWCNLAASEGKSSAFTGRSMRKAVPLLLAQALACAVPIDTRAESSPDNVLSDVDAAAMPVGLPQQMAAGLTIPWSAAIAGDEILVSQRGTGEIVAIQSGSAVRTVGSVPGVFARGDGGMLGIAILRVDEDRWLYAYHSTHAGNRIVRMRYLNGTLGDIEIVLDGLPGGSGHNGGRLAFGPDGMLYATTGEIRNPALSQDLGSLAGKILRMTPSGEVPQDNPMPGSYVYSYGHRNPQGLAWDRDGQLWSTDFGDDTWDELNRIEPGGNYGWPVAEGRAGRAEFIDPVVQWPTQEMGPSGLAFIGGTFFVAGLTGQRVWAVQADTGGAAKVSDFYAGEYGRIRDVFEGPDGKLWFLTNGRRGEPGGSLMAVALSSEALRACTLELAQATACATNLPLR